MEEEPAGSVDKIGILEVVIGVAVSVATALVLGALCAWIANAGNLYGTWLFVMLPVISGVASAVVVNRPKLRPAKLGFAISFYALGVASLGLLIFGWEGMICILMAAGVVLPTFWAGYFATRSVIKRFDEVNGKVMVSFLPLLAVGALLSARDLPAAETRTESTTLDINASPEKIWPYLFKLDKIPAPNSPLFQGGVAHPIATNSESKAVGSPRQCLLSTGSMPEQITISDFPSRLQFKVLQTPPSMTEMNPFRKVDAPHLHGYYEVKVGEFRLIPLGPNKTRIVGISSYELRIYPVAYWNLWTDAVVDQIHLAVMGEIKARVENR